ncbi:hypothetical protein [Rhizohabitans arisaemae]|uniref:hypothetical protein n=1 Tax=Rhizohabitans arisaemae TaxID=2720610 RepID=UPI0024B1D1DF|nr:hypothetical protein [Rhizohabitans arisaemae]
MDGMEAGAAAIPHLCSKMAAEDRALRLKGYEVDRFGGYELTRNDPAVTSMLQDFFEAPARAGQPTAFFRLS